MNLSDFIAAARPDEREQLCANLDTSIATLRQIGAGFRKAGPLRAVNIQLETAKLAQSAPERLSEVSRHSVNTELKQLESLLSRVKKPSARASIA